MGSFPGTYNDPCQLTKQIAQHFKMHCTNEQHQTFGHLSGPVIYELWVSKLLPELEPQVLLWDFVPLFVPWVF